MALAENRKAGFDYEIMDEFEAGVELRGTEVKSAREGKMSIMGAFVIVRGGEAYLVGAEIQPFQPNNTLENYEPQRTRRLLLHKNEIDRLIGMTKEKGLTLVPLKVYDKGGKVKILVGISRRKRKGDKREKTREREEKTEIRRRLKNSLR